MQIAQDTVVHFHYTLKTDQGEVIDSSADDAPLGYVHGTGSIIPGLEKALEGRTEGDRFHVSVPPEDGYGLRDDALLQAVPKSAFDGLGELQPGMQFQAQTSDGPRLVTIAAVAGDSVTVDGNHPLAGQTLNFDIEVANVRSATRSELEHGHVHGPDGSTAHD